MNARRLKLSAYPPSFSSEEILLHQEDFPSCEPGHIVELFQANQAQDHVLLQLSSGSLYPLNQLMKPINKETVYIEKSVAEAFHFNPNVNKDIMVRVIDPRSSEANDIGLGSIELVFKDQYLGRSEMWRLKRMLVGQCVHVNQKVELCKGSVRCQVAELWARGERVTSGLACSSTHVVFRSPTAMVYLFIQMSSEMWEFDWQGDLYFEKAIDGFLFELFQQWHKCGSSHEVTIVLFSRVYYDAKSIEDFPQPVRQYIQQKESEFYEDFYRVIVQNERFDDWNPVLLQLRNIFTDYADSILSHHEVNPNRGNSQEVKDSTSDFSMPKARISSAESGNFLEVLNISLNTFEQHYVNRNLDRTGQQSIVITPGVGVFCVDKKLSLITKQRIIDSGVGSDLICVGEPPLHVVPLLKFDKETKFSDGSQKHEDDFSLPHWINLSFYGLNSKQSGGSTSKFIPRFKLPASIEPCSNKNQCPLLKPDFDEEALRNCSDLEMMRMCDDYDANIFNYSEIQNKSQQENKDALLTAISDCESASHRLKSIRSFSNTEDIASLNTTIQNDKTAAQVVKKISASEINPFDPVNTYRNLRITPNRRRWTHIFPKDVQGSYLQQHQTLHSNNALTYHVDWKSLTKPASLPITTDYFPDKKTFLRDYLFNEYELAPEEVMTDYMAQRVVTTVNSASGNNSGSKFSCERVFDELVSQRLAHGFQLIEGHKEGGNELWLSIGRIYHCLSLNKKRIKVTRYQLRDQSSLLSTAPIHYSYNFRAPDDLFFTASTVAFKTERLDTFNWNYLDFYVSTGGDRDFPLVEPLKYWRLRMMLFQLRPKVVKKTRSIVEKKGVVCDIYDEDDNDECTDSNKDNFCRFLDSNINRIRRGSANSSNSIKFKEAMSIDELLEAMRQSMNFITETSSKMLPPFTFLSLDLINWLSKFTGWPKHQCQQYIKKELMSKHIRHASGSSRFPFVVGYVLYTLFSNSSSKKSASNLFPHGGDVDAFQNEWVEVFFDHNARRQEKESGKGADDGDQGRRFKLVLVDVDQSCKSDRNEWGHILYSSHLEECFEMNLQWTVATAALVTELVLSWARKASNLGLCLHPIPIEPFALPASLSSDPVRGTLFIEINVECLENTENVDKTECLNFRKVIAKKFGFVPYTVLEKGNGSVRNGSSNGSEISSDFSTKHQYMHCTANMFLLLPQMIESSSPSWGFVWSWNFMVSRRWRQNANTGATGDIPYMDTMLLDFRTFCRGQDGRLGQTWRRFRKGSSIDDQEGKCKEVQD